MKLVARLRLQERFRVEYEAMQWHWDCAVCNLLGQLSRAGLKDDVFMDQHMEVTSLVVNVVHVKRVQDAEDVRSCSVELRSLCSSSALGQRVYGQALALLCQREYLNDLDQIINDELCDEITMEKLNLAFCKAQTSADKWEYDLRCKSKSTVTADYLGVEIVLNIVDATSVAHGK